MRPDDGGGCGRGGADEATGGCAGAVMQRITVFQKETAVAGF